MTQQTAKRIKKGEFAGVGMWYQLAGILLSLTIVGAIIGVPLFLVGSRKGVIYKCSACNNKIEKDALVCPTCRATLTG